jgi:hypothetical protein
MKRRKEEGSEEVQEEEMKEEEQEESTKRRSLRRKGSGRRSRRRRKRRVRRKSEKDLTHICKLSHRPEKLFCKTFSDVSRSVTANHSFNIGTVRSFANCNSCSE